MNKQFSKSILLSVQYKKNLFLFLFVVLTIPVFCRNIYSPLQFGLFEAKNGSERFWVLYNTHAMAVKENAKVSYDGIREIEIEIPEDAKCIPLPEQTDFSGITITVSNNSKDFYLFERVSSLSNISITPEDADKGDFSSYSMLNEGSHLLILSDLTPWVKNRIGYKYGHTRKDVLFVNNGISNILPISPYTTAQTKLKAECCIASTIKKTIKNIKIFRKESCSKKSFFLKIDGEYNVEIKDIECYTPNDTLYGDALISVSNSSHITFNNIKIEGTYSRKDRYGYGISLNNVSDVHFYKLKGFGNWGIFGNNNLNKVSLRDCDINRFDVHCYGKDIRFDNCIFSFLYNQFSSMYGDVIFQNCKFVNATPVLFEQSYDAYTGFNLIFKDCHIYITGGKNYLIFGGKLNEKGNSERLELKDKKYPCVFIDGLTIDMPDNHGDYYIYRFKRSWNANNDVPNIKEIKRVRFKRSHLHRLRPVRDN